jgi:hypothetical protein
LSKFQFQHLPLRSIADAGNTVRVYRNSLHAFWMRMKLRRIRCGSLCFKFPRRLLAGSDAENARRNRFMPGSGLRLIRIDGSSDPERKLRCFRELGHTPPSP